MPKDKTPREARNELPLEKRFQIVEEYENSKGLTGIRKLAEKFGCRKTQVSNILKQKTLVREEYKRGFSSAKKRNRTSQYSDVNDAVWEWFKKKTEQRIPVDGPLIQEFATKVAEKLGYPEFKASSGWLTRFKERNNLSQHKLCGESADVPQATVYSWKRRLGSITSGY
ncbi:tigger transposable element-derived protein 4-like [Montipora foliosa]|uniref:tigger transposable element-derived protein 4-like n=1 Tax=Montipora foliosa TaxID=591990 RepID=UPI0035F1741B